MSAGNWVILALVAAAAAAPVITNIDNIPLNEARAWAPGTAAPAGWAGTLPIPTPMRPDSDRIIWRAVSVRAPTTIHDDTLFNTIIIDGLELNTVTPQFALVAHNSECTTAVIGANLLAQTTLAFVGSATQYSINVLPPTVGGVATRLDQIADLPYLCYKLGTGDWQNSNIMVGWTDLCLGDATSQGSGLTDPLTDLCHNIADTTLPIGSVDIPSAGASLTVTSVENSDRNSPFFMERRGRIRCCGWRNEFPVGATLGTQTLARRYGLCINPNITSCCGESLNVNSRILHSGGAGKPFDKFREKCCFKGNFPLSPTDIGTALAPAATRTAGEQPRVAFLDGWCPCTIARVDDYCNSQLPVDGYTNLCCTDTKYNELNPTATATTKWGRCYDGIRTKCCNTGELYDPGTSQCCKVNGVQSVNTLCPCNDGTHCGLNQTCCRQWTPQPLEATLSDTTPSRSRCSPYVNYPAGTSSAAQPCVGQCIDNRFHICCNGVVCINGIEKCCNDTCCNRFNQHCTPAGLRSSSSRNNFRDFRIGYDTCTTIEALTPDRGILAFLIPIVLLTAIFICYAISFFFARRVNALTPLTAYQKGIFAIASIIVLFMLPFIFAGTLYKYALLVMWGCFFTIIVSMSPYPLLYVIAALVHAVLLIYYIDPFYGNELLTLSHSKPLPNEFLTTSGVGFNGILHSISSIWNTRDVSTGAITENGLRCTALYLFWFNRDPAVEDRVRWDNPAKPTFGYCSRDYGMILYIFGGLSIILMYFLFFLTLITHLRNVLISKADRLGGAILDVDVPTGSVYN
eukprot:TRINITY_DN182_c0_g1_i1.p1 TRINITY_DN182_c0_g1~~TRINITY_DN182_c0_g1_i1.p1  ORF type:complete len:799 (-),score=136.55 TRINITY_DN182_c0_g1_i1:106-2502(-)